MPDRRQFIAGAFAGAAAVTFGMRRAQAAEFAPKWGHAMPATHPLHVRGIEAADKIRVETDGRVDLKIFPDNQLGGDGDMLNQVRSGGLEIYTAGATTIGPLVPVTGIVNVAFAFPTSEKGWEALDGDLGGHMAAAISKAGLYVFRQFWENGFRQITTADLPVNSPADLKGLKIRVPTSPILLSLFQKLGASPTSMNVSELYTALQTRLVDGEENPLSIIATRRFYEVQKYCALSNHVWDVFIDVANQNYWDGVPADLQEVIARNLNEAAVKQREDIGKLNAGLQAELEKKGLVFNTPDPEPFRAALRDSGFYSEWKATFGEEAWSVLEKYSGPLA